MATTRLDEYRSKNAFLTLVNYKPSDDYPGSDEIGVRRAEDFELLQWSGIPTRVVWPMVIKLVDKGRSTRRIQAILNWLENR